MSLAELWALVVEWIWLNAEALGLYSALAALIAIPFGLLSWLKKTGTKIKKFAKSFRKIPQKPVYEEHRISENRLTSVCELSGNLYVSGFTGNLYKFELDSKRTTGEYLVSKSIVRTLCGLQDRNEVLIGDDNGEIRSYYAPTAAVSLVGGAQSSVYDLKQGRSSSQLFSSHKDGIVREWRYGPSGSSEGLSFLRNVHTHEGPVFSLAYLEWCNAILSAGADGMLVLTSLADGTTTKQKISNFSIFGLTATKSSWFAGDAAGRVFVGEISRIHSAGRSTIFELNQEYENERFEHTDNVRTLVASASGKWVLSGSKDGSVKLFETFSKNTWILSMSDDYVYEVGILQSQDKLFSVDGSGSLKVYNLEHDLDLLSPREVNEVVG